MNTCLLAIDIGTQSTRAVLIDSNGSLLAKTTHEYDLQAPQPGWAQQDANAWWVATVSAIRDLLEQSDVRLTEIACVAVDSQMHAAIPLDRAGQVLVPAVQLWCDKRAAEVVAEFETKHSAAASFPLAGNVPTTAWQGFKIKWLQQHQPDVYAKAWKIVTVSTFIVFKLTGVLAISYAEASGTFCMDARCAIWSDNLMQLLDVSNRAKTRS